MTLSEAHVAACLVARDSEHGELLARRGHAEDRAVLLEEAIGLVLEGRRGRRQRNRRVAGGPHEAGDPGGHRVSDDDVASGGRAEAVGRGQGRLGTKCGKGAYEGDSQERERRASGKAGGTHAHRYCSCVKSLRRQSNSVPPSSVRASTITVRYLWASGGMTR